MTTKELKQLFNYWVDKLELSPPVWRNSSIAFAKDADLENNLGQINWNIDHSAFSVQIANEKSHKRDDSDIEETLIHELLHLRIEGHKELDATRDPHLEKAINILASILKEHASYYKQNK